MTFKAVLFDLDGTLADSLGDIGGALNEVLAERGLPTHATDAYRYMIGEGVQTLVRRALPADQQGLVDPLLVEFRSRYASCYARTTQPYLGIPELLEALAQEQVPMAVLSNKRDDFTQAIVREVFGRWAFREVRGERPGVPRKPDPTAALEIASCLGVSPGDCAFVGDTKFDILTAVAAGMFPVGVLWGFRGREELVSHGARALIAHPLELLTVSPTEASTARSRAE